MRVLMLGGVFGVWFLGDVPGTKRAFCGLGEGLGAAVEKEGLLFGGLPVEVDHDYSC